MTEKLLGLGARIALLERWSSRRNKLWLATTWKQADGFYINWRWAGEPFQSRLWFQLGPDEPYRMAQSYEEDIVPTLKFDKKTV